MHFWKPCALTRVRLCRTWTYDAVESSFIPQQVRQLSLLPAQKAEYRILLVIARSFKRDKTGRYRDYRPSLVLGPLLKIAIWCNRRGRLPRVRVDVVRPGTMSELELKLERHKQRPYDIVHLDMHGKIDIKPSSINASSMAATPFLRFAKHYNEKLACFRDSNNPFAVLTQCDDSLSDVEVVEVALLLQKNGITKVALSACHSSYARRNMLANMCHVFLSHGASHVSAMSSEVLENTSQIYYAAFYEALLVNGQSFLSAAAIGREALRANPYQSPNAIVPTNYHRAARVSTNDFWPKHRVRLAWPWLVTAYCLRLGAILGVTSALLPLYSPASRSGFWRGRFGTMSLASMVWYWSVRWVQPLHCPFWLWTPQQVKIFEYENLRQLSGHVEIEHLVLEDRLKFEANQGAIYVWSGDAEAALGRMVARLGQVWVRTGFVDSIDVIPAMVFTSRLSSLQWWLRLWVTHYKNDVTDDESLGRKQLVVITDIDKFYEVYLQRSRLASERNTSGISGAALTELQNALWRMTEFVSRYEVNLQQPDTDEMSVAGTDYETDIDDNDSNDDTVIGKTYLIVTGSYNDYQWQKLFWNKEETLNAIGRAVPHLHDVQPSQ